MISLNAFGGSALGASAFVAQLLDMRAQLAKMETAGVGKMIIVPQVDVSSPVPRTFNGVDYLAWPFPAYNSWYTAWAGATAEVGAYGLPWPLGNGMKVSQLIDDAVANPDEPYKASGVLPFIKTLPTITAARRALDKGLNVFSPGSVPAGGTSWTTVALGVGAVAAAFGVAYLMGGRLKSSAV